MGSVARSFFEEPSRGANCYSDLALDELLTSTPSDIDESRFLAHAKSCNRCETRFRELSEQQGNALPELFLEKQLSAEPTVQKPRSRFASSASRKATQKRRHFSRWLGGGLAGSLAIAAAIALLVVPNDKQSSISPGLRSKGGATPSIQVQVKRGERTFLAKPGAVLRPLDIVQFEITTADAQYVAVYNIEDGGTVSSILPAQDSRALSPESGDGIILDGAVELDDSVGKELFVAVFCPSAFNVSEANRALKSLNPDNEFFQKCDLTRFPFIKEKSDRSSGGSFPKTRGHATK